MEEGVEAPYDPCPRPLESERGSEEHERLFMFARAVIGG